jgi:hypothetical protein
MRPAALARFALGGACLLDPSRVLAFIGGPDRDDARTQAVVRVLGGRLVLQGIAATVLGSRTRKPDIATDLAHALSMVVAAARWPDHRRSAVTSAGLATATAALDVWAPGS